MSTIALASAEAWAAGACWRYEWSRGDVYVYAHVTGRQWNIDTSKRPAPCMSAYMTVGDIARAVHDHRMTSTYSLCCK